MFEKILNFLKKQKTKFMNKFQIPEILVKTEVPDYTKNKTDYIQIINKNSEHFKKIFKVVDREFHSVLKTNFLVLENGLKISEQTAGEFFIFVENENDYHEIKVEYLNDVQLLSEDLLTEKEIIDANGVRRVIPPLVDPNEYFKKLKKEYKIVVLPKQKNLNQNSIKKEEIKQNLETKENFNNGVDVPKSSFEKTFDNVGFDNNTLYKNDLEIVLNFQNELVLNHLKEYVKNNKNELVKNLKEKFNFYESSESDVLNFIVFLSSFKFDKTLKLNVQLEVPIFDIQKMRDVSNSLEFLTENEKEKIINTYIELILIKILTHLIIENSNLFEQKIKENVEKF